MSSYHPGTKKINTTRITQSSTFIFSLDLKIKYIVKIGLTKESVQAKDSCIEKYS